MVEQAKQLEPDYSKMEYRNLGPTGLKVSVLGYGNWLNSDKQEAYDFTRDAIRECLANGVNFYDSAEIYGAGEAERQMGQAFQDLNVRRESVVVTTKIWKIGSGVNDHMGSRKHIVEAVTASVKRMQLDYVDVVYMHRPDYECDLEETCAAFHYVIEKGLAFYWGTSEWTAQRITSAIGICEKNGWHKPIVEQPQYSMLRRDKFEREFHHIFERFGYGSTIWSPVCGGILTGKYNDGTCPDNARFTDDQNGSTFTRYFGPQAKDKTVKMLNELAAFAKELGCSQAQLALAWAVANQDVSVALLGFTRLEQIRDNMQAVQVLKNWTKETEARCNAILDNEPEEEFILLKGQNKPNRRKANLYTK